MSCHQYEIRSKEPEYTAICQYGEWIEAGLQNWILRDPYYVIDGKRYEGEYKPLPIGEKV